MTALQLFIEPVCIFLHGYTRVFCTKGENRPLGFVSNELDRSVFEASSATRPRVLPHLRAPHEPAPLALDQRESLLLAILRFTLSQIVYVGSTTGLHTDDDTVLR